eukprot:scaffold25923_cov105-Isochrysis_galbana.AAC.1
MLCRKHVCRYLRHMKRLPTAPPTADGHRRWAPQAHAAKGGEARGLRADMHPPIVEQHPTIPAGSRTAGLRCGAQLPWRSLHSPERKVDRVALRVAGGRHHLVRGGYERPAHPPRSCKIKQRHRNLERGMRRRAAATAATAAATAATTAGGLHGGIRPHGGDGAVDGVRGRVIRRADRTQSPRRRKPDPPRPREETKLGQ